MQPGVLIRRQAPQLVRGVGAWHGKGRPRGCGLLLSSGSRCGPLLASTRARGDVPQQQFTAVAHSPRPSGATPHARDCGWLAVQGVCVGCCS